MQREKSECSDHVLVIIEALKTLGELTRHRKCLRVKYSISLVEGLRACEYLRGWFSAYDSTVEYTRSIPNHDTMIRQLEKTRVKIEAAKKG